MRSLHCIDEKVFKYLSGLCYLEELKIIQIQRGIYDKPSVMIEAISQLQTLKNLNLQTYYQVGPSFRDRLTSKKIASLFVNLKNLVLLKLDSQLIDNEVVNNISKYCPNLEYLTLRKDYKEIHENPDLKAISKLKLLKSLELKGFLDVSTLIPVFAKLENLQNLEISGVHINTEVFEAIVGCPKLKSLSLKRMEAQLDNNMSGIISRLKNLSSLNLSYAILKTDEFTPKYLKDPLPPNYFFSLFQNSKMNNLLELNLEVCDINVETLKVISLSCPQLEELSIRSPTSFKMRGPALHELSGFPKFPKLKTLNFDKSDEDQDWPTTIDIISIFANKNVENLLNLRIPGFDQYINNEVMLAIAFGCPKLEFLDIFSEETTVTDQGIIYLIRYCHNLRKLKLSDMNLITEQCKTEIKKHLPRLCIYNYP